MLFRLTQSTGLPRCSPHSVLYFSRQEKDCKCGGGCLWPWKWEDRNKWGRLPALLPSDPRQVRSAFGFGFLILKEIHFVIHPDQQGF